LPFAPAPAAFRPQSAAVLFKLALLHEQVGAVLGRGGEMQKRLEARYRVKIKGASKNAFLPGTDLRTVMLRSFVADDIERCLAEVIDVIALDAKHPARTVALGTAGSAPPPGPAAWDSAAGLAASTSALALTGAAAGAGAGAGVGVGVGTRANSGAGATPLPLAQQQPMPPALDGTSEPGSQSAPAAAGQRPGESSFAGAAASSQIVVAGHSLAAVMNVAVLVPEHAYRLLLAPDVLRAMFERSGATVESGLPIQEYKERIMHVRGPPPSVRNTIVSLFHELERDPLGRGLHYFWKNVNEPLHYPPLSGFGDDIAGAGLGVGLGIGVGAGVGGDVDAFDPLAMATPHMQQMMMMQLPQQFQAQQHAMLPQQLPAHDPYFQPSGQHHARRHPQPPHYPHAHHQPHQARGGGGGGGGGSGGVGVGVVVGGGAMAEWQHHEQQQRISIAQAEAQAHYRWQQQQQAHWQQWQQWQQWQAHAAWYQHQQMQMQQAQMHQMRAPQPAAEQLQRPPPPQTPEQIQRQQQMQMQQQQLDQLAQLVSDVNLGPPRPS
jgi:hypothetical protein